MKEFIDYAKSIGIKSIDIDTLCLLSTFLKKQESKQSSLNGVSNTEGKLQAVDDLIEFARNNCREWNNDEMEEIIDRL